MVTFHYNKNVCAKEAKEALYDAEIFSSGGNSKNVA